MASVVPPLVNRPESANGMAEASTAWRLSETALNRARGGREKVVLVLSFPAPAADPLTWLSRQSATPAIYWHDRDGWEYAAAGAAHVIVKKGPDAISAAATEAVAFLQGDLVTETGPLSRQIRFFGGFAFDPAAIGDDLWREGGFVDAVLVLPEALYVRRELQSHLLFAIVVTPGVGSAEILIELKRLNDRYWQGFSTDSSSAHEASGANLTPQIESDHDDKQRWLDSAIAVLRRIERGELQKVVLARRQCWDDDIATRPADPWEVTRALRQHAPGCYHFAFGLQGNRTFVGASPERLFRLTGPNLESECLAGTIGRGTDERADRQMGAELLAAIKDRHEHELVVTGVRDALQPLSQWLEISAAPEILTLATLQHLRTSVRALLKDDIGIGEVLRHLHPTPAVGGWPREPAMQVIRETEPTSRGWYAAPVGWIARDAAEFAVGIRSGLLVDRTLCLFAGAGLVDGSDAEAEWLETTDKLRAFLTALHQ